MGRDKAMLPFGSERMLQRVVRLISESVPRERIVVVAAPRQALPALPREISVARDAEEYRGPLEGLALGLRALGDRAEAVYATSCDVPLLVPAFVDRMFELLDEFDVAVPTDGEHDQTLAAVYRPSVLGQVEQLLDAGELRLRALLTAVRVREIPVDELRAVDPRLLTLENVNSEADYRAALAAAGVGG